MAKYSCVVCGKDFKSSESCYQSNKTCLCFDCRDCLQKESHHLSTMEETEDFLNKIKHFLENNEISSELQSFFQKLLDTVSNSVIGEQIKADNIKEIKKYVQVLTWVQEDGESWKDYIARIEFNMYVMIKKGYKLHTFGVGSCVTGYISGHTNTSGGIIGTPYVHGHSSGSTSTSLVYHAVFLGNE